MLRTSGINVLELRRLSEEYPTLTTRQLHEIIKNETSDRQISYVNLLERNGLRHLVGKHCYFISHCWDYNFSFVVQSLLDYPPIKYNLKKRIPVFVWFDVFSLNQHDSFHSEEFLTLFKKIIKRSVRTLSVWLPHNLPDETIIPQLPLGLTRVWCLFEWFYTYKVENEVEFVMPKHVRRSYKSSLLSEIKRDHLDDFENIDLIDDIFYLDIKEAEATVPDDIDLILGYIKDEFSRDKFSEFIQHQIKRYIYDDICDLSSKKHSRNQYIKSTAKSFYKEAEEIDMMYIDTKKRKIRK